LSGLLQRRSADLGFEEKAVAEVGLVWSSSGSADPGFDAKAVALVFFREERVGGSRLRGKGGC
jgi:hypothetical protein